jgi:hypothetical protein
MPPTGQTFESEAAPPKRKRGRPPKNQPEQAAPAAAPVSEAELLATTVGLMELLSTFVDESFQAVDPATGRPTERVQIACAQMKPWVDKYGTKFLAAGPWLGLGLGMITLLGPALPATVAIVTGQKQPRCLRAPSNGAYPGTAAAAIVDIAAEPISAGAPNA